MADAMTIQNYDLGSVAIGNNEYKSGLIQFPGADTYLEGTIMALKEVVTAIVDTPDVGNTGDGTLVATVAGGSVIPVVGNYNFECTFAVTNGGVFKLEDPNGVIVADNLTLRVGAGLVTTFNVGGIQIVVTEGATDFAAGDIFLLAVVADGDFVIYAVDGVGGAQIPKYVLREDYTATGATDLGGRVMISGKVRSDKLIIDGSAAGVGITDILKDKLLDYGIIVIDSKDFSQLDNQ